MKSMISSDVRHDARLVMKRLLLPGLAALLVFMILIPVSTSMIGDISIFNVDYTHEQLKFRFAADEVASWIGIAAYIAGALTGFSLFAFVTDKRRSAFYFSLGISRKKLYAVRLLAGLFTSAVAAFVPMTVSLLLNYKALGGYDGILPYYTAATLLIFLQEAAGILIFAAGCFLAGTAQEAAAAGVSLSAAVPVAAYCLNALMKQFTWGNTSGASTYAMAQVRPGLVSELADYDPVCFSVKHIKDYNSFSREMSSATVPDVSWAPVIAWAVAICAGAFVVYILFERYKAENSSISGTCPFSEGLISVVWPLAASAVCLDYFGKIGTGAAVAAAVTAMLLTYAVIAYAFLFRQKSLGVRLRGLAVLAAITAVFTATSLTSGFGYLSRIPAADDVASAEITYIGQPSLIPARCNVTLNGSSAYYSGNVTLTSAEGICLAEELDKDMLQQGKAPLASGGSDFGDTVVPYDIEVSYSLKNGRTVTRYYDRASAANLARFLRLGATDELRQATGDVITGNLSTTLWNSEAFSEGEIFLADSWFTDVKKISLSQEYRSQLLAAISHDVASLGTDALYYPASDVRAQLLFTLSGESDASTFICSSSASAVYITDAYTETLALLSQWGVAPDDAVPEIESVSIQKYDPYSSMNALKSPVSMLFSGYMSDSGEDYLLQQDFGTRPEIKDQQQISQIVQGCRSTYFMDGGGYLLSFRIRGMSSYVYKFLPSDAAPDFISEKMK